MSRNSRLSSSVHVLLHLADGGTLTSEALAGSLRTNPVVVRQTLAGLREAGIVRSERGHGGGWSLGRDTESITLRDVYVALDEPTLFSLRNRSENPNCLVEKAVNAALTSATVDAQALFIERMGTISLASMLREFHGFHASAHNVAEVCADAV
jgi:DNA-binding IscR family transcriptional regulator